MWSSASSFSFRYPFFSWRSINSCFRLLTHLSVMCHFLYLSFPNVFQKKVLSQEVTNPVNVLFISCRVFLPAWLHVILHFSHDRSNWSWPSFSGIAFQNYSGISVLFCEVSKFQLHTINNRDKFEVFPRETKESRGKLLPHSKKYSHTQHINAPCV
jgi:hypothetical protein